MALKLGQPNVDAMLRRISLEQFRDWQAYYQLEPFDEERMDIRLAQIVATIMNTMRHKKSDKVFSWSDVLIQFGSGKSERKPRQSQSWQHMKAMMLLYGNTPSDKEEKH